VNKKAEGYAVEALVLSKLLNFGFVVSRTEGDYSPYEMISDWHGKLLRIQVKSTSYQDKNNGVAWRIVVSAGCDTKHVYTKEDCDFVICYIKPLGVFYIIPVEKLSTTKISLHPERDKYKKSKTGQQCCFRYERFKERWDLLQ